jgi:hypothetical protein
VSIKSAIWGRLGGDVLDDRLSHALSETQRAIGDNERLQERLIELELALEDAGWETIAGFGEDYQFSREALDKIIRLSRMMYLKNPIIRRPVDLQSYYVWAQGYSVKAEGPLGKVIENFLKDPSNINSLTGPDAVLDNERRLRCEGNIFYAFYVNKFTGRTQIRRIRVDEMRSIVHSPDDSSEPYFYLRQWTSPDGTMQRRYYPDFNYVRKLRAEKATSPSLTSDDTRLSSYSANGQDVPIDWDVPILHKKVGGFSDWDFGVPEVYPALDWAKAYKEIVEDYKKTVKSLAKWAWQLKKGGANQAQINAAQSALQSMLSIGSSGYDTNPPPVTGSAFITSDQNELKAIDVSKAVVDPDKFKVILLQACAALGMPLNFYGDTSAGSMATARTLDRPTELGFRSRQTMWMGVFSDILTFVIEAAALATKNSAIKLSGYDEQTGLMKITANGRKAEVDIDMSFPPILQQNTQEMVQALVTGLTLNGQPLQVMNDGPTILRVFLGALGIDEVDDIIEVFYPEGGGKSTAKPIETYEAPLTPAQAAAAKNEQVVSPKFDAPPESAQKTKDSMPKPSQVADQAKRAQQNAQAASPKGGQND